MSDVLRPEDHAIDCAIEIEVRRLATVERVTPGDLDAFLATPCTCYAAPREAVENEAVWVVVLALLVVAVGVVVWMVV